MNYPTISVIIPVYNGERGLEKCINSVLEQTYKYIEVIVVDDGSTDKSADICALMADKDKRVKVITTGNKGVSSSRNKGLLKASGEYVAFIDADDYLEKDAYRQCIDIMEDNPKADILKFGFYSESNQKKWINNLPYDGMINRGEYNEKIYPNLSKGDVFRTVWNAVFRKEILSNVRFNEDLIATEDLLFVSDAILKTNAIYLYSSPLYHHVRYKNSLSRMAGIDENTQKMRDIAYVYEKVEKDLNEGGFNDFRGPAIEYLKGTINDKLCIVAGNHPYEKYKKAVGEWLDIGGPYLCACLNRRDRSFFMYIYYRAKKNAKKMLGK